MSVSPPVQSDLETRLAAELAANDPRAPDDVLRAFGGRTRAALVRRFGNLLSDADLEDVLAVAIAKLWLHAKRFDPARSPLSAWFGLLAYHAAVDLLRARRDGLVESGPTPD